MSRTRSEKPGRAALVIKVLVVVTAVAAVALASAVGCHHRHGHHGERMREFAEWRIERMLKKVDATPEQKEGVMSAVDGLIVDLKAMHDDGGDLHEVLVAELTAESIDRTALEVIRAEKMQELDVASRRVLDTVASVGEILSQDQRLALAEEARKHHRHHRWGRD